MNIRVMGSKDLVVRLNNLLGPFGGKIYENRGNSKDKRLYISIDDRQFEKFLNHIDLCDSELCNGKLLHKREKVNEDKNYTFTSFN